MLLGVSYVFSIQELKESHVEDFPMPQMFFQPLPRLQKKLVLRRKELNRYSFRRPLASAMSLSKVLTCILACVILGQKKLECKKPKSP